MALHVDDLRVEVFFHAVLAVGTTDTALLHTSMETLDGFEVLTVDLGFAKFYFTANASGCVDVLGED